MPRIFSAVAISVLAAAAALSATQATAADCRGLVGKTFGSAVIVETDEVASPLVLSNFGSDRVSVAAPFCRVRGVSTPTADSNINFEVWLPPASGWNGKYEGVGNGGFLGAIMYEAMERGLRAGYAVSATDTGHASNILESKWALGHPEKIADWGWRAIHETALASKSVIAAYYSAPPRLSYFLGCSKGGGSSMMEAQRFPTDYNGIISGAPGWNQSGQVTSYLWSEQAAALPGGWLSSAKIALLHQAVLTACNGRDGMLDDPGACRFDPVVLQCKSGATDNCLTPQQVTTVRMIYSGPRDANGKSLYPGLARGSELGWPHHLMGPIDRPVVGSQIYPSMMGYLGNLVFGDTNWDFHALKPDAVMERTLRTPGSDFNATDPDLSAFKAAGGKLIHFQGWDDPIVRPEASILYFNAVTARMGGPEQVRSFYRLFMAPGMDHCSGGVGPNAVGGPYNLPSSSRDPEHDIFAALEDWVEHGRAPERLVATLYSDNDSAKAIVAQRPWCAYPAIARYTGTGDPKQAGSYVCEGAGR